MKKITRRVIKAGATIAAFAAVTGNTIGGTLPANDGSVYNPANNNLSHLSSAIENVKNGTADSDIIWAGSSTASGFYSGGDGAGTQYSNTNSEQPLFAKQLTEQYGIKADANAVFGYPVKRESGLGHSGDARIKAGTGWEQDSVASVGGPMFVNSTSTDALSITLPTTSDTVTIYFPTDNTIPLGIFTYQINDGPATTVDEGAAAPAMASIKIAGIKPGENTLTLKRVSGTVKFIGEVSSLSTEPAIHVINSGVGGWKAIHWDDRSGKPYATNQAWSALSPSAVFIELSNNDAVSNTPDDVYKTEMGKIIAGAGPQVDVVIIGQAPYGANAGNVDNLKAKIEDQKQLAAEYGVPFIDKTKDMPSYDHTSDGKGGADLDLVHGDGFHANPKGYRDQTDFVTKRVMAMAGKAPKP